MASVTIRLLRCGSVSLSREAVLGGKEGFVSALRQTAAPASAAPVVNQTSNASVQAPVSINVTAAGSDPEAVGRSIYDVAERYLLRTIEQAL